MAITIYIIIYRN